MFLETAVHVTSKLKKGKHIAACDGSRALHSAAETAAVLSLKGVSHLNFRWTPLSTIPKKGLDNSTRDLLRRLVADGVAKEKKDLFMLAGGDQIAESHANVGKRELRRCNLLFNDSKDTIDHRNLLAAHYLNKGPGLKRVLRALAILRAKACEACVVPRDAFKKALWQT